MTREPTYLERVESYLVDEFHHGLHRIMLETTWSDVRVGAWTDDLRFFACLESEYRYLLANLNKPLQLEMHLRDLNYSGTELVNGEVSVFLSSRLPRNRQTILLLHSLRLMLENRERSSGGLAMPIRSLRREIHQCLRLVFFHFKGTSDPHGMQDFIDQLDRFEWLEMREAQRLLADFAASWLERRGVERTQVADLIGLRKFFLTLMRWHSYHPKQSPGDPPQFEYGDIFRDWQKVGFFSSVHYEIDRFTSLIYLEGLSHTPVDGLLSATDDQVLGESSEPVMAHILFLDQVGFSKLPMAQQREIHNDLTRIVSDLHTVQRYRRQEQLKILPTGDGMALVFLGGAKPHVEAAVELHRALAGKEQIKLRVGLHTGPVDSVIDINRQPNVLGSGINLAQRVMDCGDAGHILLSNAVAEILSGLGGWENTLQDLGTYRVKHGVPMHLFNLRGADFGNDERPSKPSSPLQTSTPTQPGEVERRGGDYPSKDIVRAWFKDAINPFLDRLRSEDELLQQESWTWSEQDMRFGLFDFLYQPSSYQANQEDFLEAFPNIVEALKQHDEMLVSLDAQGEKLFDELRQSSSLRAAFAEATTPDALRSLKEEYRGLAAFQNEAEILSRLFGTRIEEQQFSWLAELAMNRGSLDSSWFMAPFWRRNKQTFVNVVPLCVSHPEVLQARHALRQVIQGAMTALKKARKELSERHGVPPV
jgi:class 3 adenylate cyclase